MRVGGNCIRIMIAVILLSIVAGAAGENSMIVEFLLFFCTSESMEYVLAHTRILDVTPLLE